MGTKQLFRRRNKTLAYTHHPDDLVLLSFDGDHNTPDSVNKTKVLKEKKKELFCFTLRFLPRCADWKVMGLLFFLMSILCFSRNSGDTKNDRPWQKHDEKTLHCPRPLSSGFGKACGVQL